MPITLFIGDGWNPLLPREDDWDEFEDADEVGGEDAVPAGAAIAASADRARERFLAMLGEELPEGIEIRIAPAAEGEGSLWEESLTDEEEDLVADLLSEGYGSSRPALVANFSDALHSVLDAALEDRSAWVVED